MLNTSRFSRYVSAIADLRLRPYARVAVTSGAAIVLVLGALLAFDMPESLAEGGLFEELFGSPHRQRVVEPMYYAPREHGWRVSRRHHGRHYAHHVRYARHPPFPRRRSSTGGRASGAGADRRLGSALGLRAHLRRLFLSRRRAESQFANLLASGVLRHAVPGGGDQAVRDARRFGKYRRGGRGARRRTLFANWSPGSKLRTRSPPLAAAIRPPAIRSTPAPSSTTRRLGPATPW